MLCRHTPRLLSLWSTIRLLQSFVPNIAEPVSHPHSPLSHQCLAVSLTLTTKQRTSCSIHLERNILCVKLAFHSKVLLVQVSPSLHSQVAWPPLVLLTRFNLEPNPRFNWSHLELIHRQKKFQPFFASRANEFWLKARSRVASMTSAAY